MAKIFISYSHADEKWKNRVGTYLKILETQKDHQIWDDRKIKPGDNWEKEIKIALDTADIAIFLVTQTFLNSDYIRGKEVPLLLERRKNENIRIFPVIVEPCNWELVEWLKNIQLFPKDGKSLSLMTNPKVKQCLTQLVKLVNEILNPCHENKLGVQISSGSGKSVLLTGLPKRKIELLGRERELKELEEKIKQSQRLLLVNGMGGIGKTEVCKRFFMEHYCQYPYAAWVDYTGSFKQSVTNAFKIEKTGIPETSNVDDQFNLIMEYIHDLNDELFMVVDNISQIPANDAELELVFRFPQHVRVIATSRLTIDGFEVYPLDVLSEAACIKLFYTFYKGKPYDESVKEIIGLCGFHTLTVELLARTAQNSMKPVKVLLDILKEKGFNLSDAIPETTGTFYGNETRQKKFFDHLLTLFELTTVTENEEHLLSNISVLPSLYISVEQIKDWLELESIEDITASIKKGWLKADDNFNIYMHPVIGEVVRQRTKPDSSKCATLIQSLTWKLNIESGENPMDKVPFVIFGETLLRYIHDETEDVASLANNLSATYLSIGQLEQALEFGLKALTIREKVLGAEHPDLATSYNNLSLIYKTMGQLEQSLELGLKANKLCEKVLGENHPNLASSYNNLSLIYKNMGQLEQALEFGFKDLAISEKVLGAEHPDLATSYNNLSTIYSAMGQLEQALEFKLKSLAIEEKVLPPDHPQMGSSYNNLSLIYKDMGQLDKALPYMQKAIAILEKLFPNGHPNLDIMRKNHEILLAKIKKNV